MAKALPIEQVLTHLHSLRGRTHEPEVREELRRALSHRSNLIVAKAARIIEEAKLESLSTDLEAAFDRLMSEPAPESTGRTKHRPEPPDRGCEAKTAIVRALYEIGAGSESLYLRGIRYVQPEPSFGGSTDSAAELRGICCLGLMRLGYRRIFDELVERLFDSEPQTRLLAVRAVGGTGAPEGVNLLKLLLLSGAEREVDVMAEAFAALLSLSGSTLDFVARYLDNANDAIAQAAALAIGASKRPAALERLQRHWQDHPHASTRRMLLLPIVMTRSPEAMDFVLNIVAQSPPALAEAAIEALAIHRHDPMVRDRLQKALEARGQNQETATLAAALNRHFG